MAKAITGSFFKIVSAFSCTPFALTRKSGEVERRVSGRKGGGRKCKDGGGM